MEVSSAGFVEVSPIESPRAQASSSSLPGSLGGGAAFGVERLLVQAIGFVVVESARIKMAGESLLGLFMMSFVGS
jgi:hypothetical protein